VVLDGVVHEVGQANNVFVFPGIGIGAIVSEARGISDAMVLAAARTLAAQVGDERLASGALYPSISGLRSVSRAIGLAVAREAVASGLAPPAGDEDLERALDAAMWWPSYVDYTAV
jgi:malic enzyme